MRLFILTLPAAAALATVALTAAAPAAAGDIIKCRLPGGKTLYQAPPCPAAALGRKEIVVDKQSPAQIDAAETKLKAWQARQRLEQAEQAKAAQADYDREVLKALNRAAAAQQQQAYVLQAQAEVLQRQNAAPAYDNGYRPYLYYGPQYYPQHYYSPSYQGAQITPPQPRPNEEESAGRPGANRPGLGQPGFAQPGYSQPGSLQPQPGFAQPESVRPVYPQGLGQRY